MGPGVARAIALLCSAGILVGRAAAEEPGVLTPGMLCRVTAPGLAGSPFIGTLADVDAGKLVLVAPESGRRTIPFDAITRVETSTGRRTRTVAYALRGAVLGGLVGAVGGATADGDCKGLAASCAAMSAFVRLRSGAPPSGHSSARS